MGKLTGLILGVSAALFMAYYVLASAYVQLTGWLSPVLGPSFSLMLSLLYLLLGNPVNHPVLFAVWITVGAVTGIGARRGGRAAGAAFTTYMIIWSFLSLTVISMLLGAGLGSPSGTGFAGGIGGFPPLPPGTSISSILTEPLMQRLIQLFGMIGSLSGLTGLPLTSYGSLALTGSVLAPVASLIPGIISLFLPYLILNFVILVLTAYFTGRVLHLIIEPRGQNGNGGNHNGREKKKSQKVRKVRVKRVRQAHYAMFVASLFVFSAIALQLGNAGYAQIDSSGLAHAVHYNSDFVAVNSPGNASADTYLNLFKTLSTVGSNTVNTTRIGNQTQLYYSSGIVGTYGNVYNTYGFLGELNSTTGWEASQQAKSSLFTIVAVSDNLSSLISGISQNGLSAGSSSTAGNFLGAIPRLVIISAYSGNQAQTEPSANSVAVQIVNATGGHSLIKLLSFTGRNGLFGASGGNVSVYIYSADASLYTAENGLAGQMSTSFNGSGILDLFRNGMSSGYLVPGYTPASVDASFFISGVINVRNLSLPIPSFSGVQLNSSVVKYTNVAFMGGFFNKNYVFHSSSSRHNISAAAIFNYKGNITFANPSVIYVLGLAYPNETSSGSGSLSSIYRILTFTTTPGNNNTTGVSGNNTVIAKPYGSAINLSNLTIETNATFPANMPITISVNMTNKTAARIITTVTVNDNDTVTNLSINQSSILSSYSSSVMLTSGKISSGNISSLGPNQSVQLKFELYFKNPGSYVIPSPMVTYTMNNRTFTVTGSPQVVAIANPPLITSINNMEKNSAAVISTVIHNSILTEQIFPGFYVFDLIPLLIVLVDIRIEYKSFRKWLMLRKGQTGQLPP